MVMEIEVCFEDHKSAIAQELASAKKSVFVAVAWIDFTEYYDIFDNVLDRNVNLNIICSDNTSNRKYQNEIDYLINKGAEIKLLALPSIKNHMHHKYVVIDDSTVLNGSFNWSTNVQKSFENIMIIKGCTTKVINSFKSEFNKLLKLDKKYLSYLQKTTKCQENDCIGELLNVLFFSKNSSVNSEVFADIIQMCNNCGEYKIVKECVLDSQLYVLLSEYSSCISEKENDILCGYIEEHMNSYIKKNNIVFHGIGKVSHTLDSYDDDDICTNILWKNKFVGNRLPDKLDSDLDVCYDNN